MRLHKRTNHEEKRQCPACEFEAVSRNEYFQHFEQNNSSEKCVYCDYVAGCGQTLRVHMEKCRDRKEHFKCDECGKRFRHYQTLYKHLKNEHDLEATFPCDICGNKFFNEVALKSHNDRIHLGITKDVKCDQCGKAVQSMKGLKHHMRRTHGVDRTLAQSDTEEAMESFEM